MKHKKSLALLASAAMTVSSVAPAFTSVAMAEGTAKYKDGTYTVTKTVTPDEDEDFAQYDLQVSFTVTDGLVAKIEAKQVSETDDFDANLDYIEKAVYGTKKSTGLSAQIIDKQSAEGLDAVSKATCASNAIIDAAKEALELAKIPDTPDVSVADKTALQDAVNAAAGYEESKYTAESWAALQTALASANEVLEKEDATQGEVDAAKTNLEAAAAALVEAPIVPAVDKTALNEAIEGALIDQGNYTDETWQAYTEALTAAKAVQADETATQEAVNAALEALTNAQQALAEKPAVSDSVYVLMNIPYDEFYKADLEKNDVKVDAMTSATKNKTRTGSLVGGSYHVNEDGTDITGVIYPVKISNADKAVLDGCKQVTDDSSVTIKVTNRGQTSETEYKGKDALFESDSYSYYILSETPAAYKEVSVGEDGKLSFGKIETSNVTELDATAELETSTTYGDYQINVDGLPEEKLENISGVMLETTDGTSYGLRHLENIWRKSELAFSTGFTKEVHGCPTSWEHYESIMGKTISKITYVTQEGEYTIQTDLYVPVKTGITATAEGTEGTGTAEVKFSKDLPADFAPVYTAKGIEIKAEGNTLQYENAKPGKYTVTVSDEKGKYDDISAELTVQSKATGSDFIKIENGSSNLTSADANVTIADYVKNITSVTVNGKVYSATGRSATKLFFDNGYLDITAAPFAGSADFKAGASYEMTIQADGYPDATLTYTVPDTIYAYANLSYGEYWANEAVQAAGNTTSSEELDSHNETDKGAFDAVSRATTNHGLHRGSFQQSTVIHTDAGKDFEISHWNDGNTLVLVDGSTVGYNKGVITYTEGRTQKTATLTSYNITGIKYVPVAVNADDFAEFLANRGANYVVVNGGAMAGGYGEGTLSSYTAIANVTANTNGLKAVSKNADGSFSFAAAKTGTDSGLLGESQNKASDITMEVKKASGSYGEFLRVDLTGDGYGALGDKMQTVEWTYYGSDSTYTTPVAHYGTKFAADDWMHKSMGIQLGLTDSIRCTLPAGTDGTGYWALTVRALGYEDYTVKFEASEENIVKGQVKGDLTALKELVAKASEKQESDYSAESWKAFKEELDEANEMIKQDTATQAEVDEQITHLQNAMDNLKKAAVFEIKEGSNQLTSSDANVNIADYVQKIQGVTVNGVAYPATGSDATKLFFDNGYLDITAAPFAGSADFKAGATYNITIQAEGYEDAALTYTVPNTIYAYANLSYGEYWANEAVQAAGDTTSSEEIDSHNETDKGAFDAVSRATTNHGLHRGSFQQSTVIHTDAGVDFAISHWSADGKTLTLTDGSTVGYDKGTITYIENGETKTATLTSYNITGIKYVPVAVSANDFAEFLANRGANYVVVNGGAMAGGYGENKLSAYTATANVTANTNGLKAVSKNADGSFSFAAAKTGTDSGLLGESQNKASDITMEVKKASGSYGEFLRVDLTGDGYGALGSKMQTVEWTYYGDDSTYTTSVAHYGTKFAADDWMHKSMGIQLGLTDSIRCTLPAGTDGTGYWALTVRALGYEDYTVQFQATDENIVKDQVTVKGDFTALKELVKQASEKKENDYSAESWKAFKDELDETNEMIEKGTATQAEINEQITHLQNAMDNLKTVPGNFDDEELKALVKQAEDKKESDYTSDSWKAFNEELNKLKDMIAGGTAPQSEIDAQRTALQNAMNALAKKNSSGSGSSSSSSSSSTTNNTTNTTTTNNTTVQTTPVSVGGTSPKTGDPTSLIGWAIAGLGSIGGLGALIRKRKK